MSFQGIDRWLARPGVDEPSTLTSKAQALRLLLVLNVAANHLLASGFTRAAVLGVCLVAVCFPRTRRVGLLAAALTHGQLLFVTFPVYANHNYLQLVLLLVAAALDPRKRDEQMLLLQTTRWMILLVFLWSGLQKVLYGTYFGGEYLAFRVSFDERFSGSLGIAMPAAELSRLQGITEIAPGAGPFRVNSVGFLAISNAVYLSEILAALLLLWPAARAWAWLAGLMVVVGIELVARELMFGLLCVSLFLCFPPRDLNRRLLPYIAGTYTIGLLMHFQWLPGWWFN